MSEDDTIIEITADIVSAYVANNSVPASQLPGLIANVFASLTNLGGVAAQVEESLVPAVSIKKSVTPDYLISLEDGRKFKSLKRHLSTSYGMTPSEYRAKWGLPSDYPMVAPGYAAKRSELARTFGLGQKRTSERANTLSTTAASVPAKRGRPKKAA